MPEFLRMSETDENRDRRVEDYLRGNADEDAVRRMEIEMLDDDELFERVQREDLLRQGMGEAERDASRGEQARSRRAAPAARLAWALAACFGAVALLLGAYSLHLAERIDALQSPTAGLPVVTLFEQRSLLPETADPSVHLAGHEGPVLLEIDVSGFPHESFQLELVGEQGSMIWEKQVPDARGYLTILAPKAQWVTAIRIRGPDGEILKTHDLNRE